MADEYLFKTSNESPHLGHDMIDKEVLYVQDTNGGSYSGQITIETSSLANSNRFLDYSNAYLEIPFVVSLQCSASLTGADSLMNGFMVGLKNGHHQIIDSIQIDFGGTNAVQLQPYLNFFVSYKLNTELSKSDVDKYGDVIGFDLDNACSAIYSAGASATGNGTTNVTVFDNNVGAANSVLAPNYRKVLDKGDVNQGFYNRMKNKALDLQPAIGSINAGTGWNSNPGLSSAVGAAAVAKNYFTTNGAAAEANIGQWSIMACIRMKDLSDFMAKLPLLRGAYLRMTISYNSVSGTITGVAAGPTLINTSLTQLSGRTNPLLMSSCAYGNPMNPAVASANAVFTVGCGIAKSSNPVSTISTPIQSCRLYVPAYQLNPTQELLYLTSQPQKTIIYDDIYNFNVVSVGANGSFSNILTNGLVNVKKVIVIPVFNGVAGNAATAALVPYQSFFDTVPATTSPLAAITNFNVQISGQNMFQQNELYDFQQFLDEMSVDSGINGGLDVGLQSGLIGFKEWTHNYRYYVCDVSRRLPAEDKIPKSVVITGTNASAKILDLICFVVYERRMVIDVETGQPIASAL